MLHNKFNRNWIINEDFKILGGRERNRNLKFNGIINEDFEIFEGGERPPFVKILNFVLIFSYNLYKNVSYKISLELDNT